MVPGSTIAPRIIQSQHAGWDICRVTQKIVGFLVAAALQRLTRDIFLYFNLPYDAKPSEE